MKHTICIAGKNQIAIDGLAYLIKIHADKKLIALPNRSDDGVDSWQPSFLRYIKTNGIEQKTLDEVQEIENLIFISLEYDRIVKPSNFRSSELFNVHFSLLPKYKGMYTSALPILFGEDYSGVTLHKIDKGIDTGDIIDQVQFSIALNDNARDLYFKYLKHANNLLLANINNLISQRYKTTQQLQSNSTYFSKESIDYSAVVIDFNKTAFQIHNQFRAFTFREYQIPTFNKWQIFKTKITKQKSVNKPGTIVEEQDDLFVVSTIDYNICLFKDYYPILWIAAKEDDSEKITEIVKYIDDINLLNKDGWNALILATFNGNFSSVKNLILCGANPSATNHKGTTILMYAFSFYEKTKDDRIFRYLLKNGADPLAKDKSGKSLADYMNNRNCLDLMKLI